MEERKQPKKVEERKARRPEDDRAFFRAPNEDDDGYDPYSDRPATQDFYEEDPWR